jgi:hypothetical protein
MLRSAQVGKQKKNNFFFIRFCFSETMLEIVRMNKCLFFLVLISFSFSFLFFFSCCCFCFFWMLLKSLFASNGLPSRHSSLFSSCFKRLSTLQLRLELIHISARTRNRVNIVNLFQKIHRFRFQNKHKQQKQTFSSKRFTAVVCVWCCVPEVIVNSLRTRLNEFTNEAMSPSSCSGRTCSLFSPYLVFSFPIKNKQNKTQTHIAETVFHSAAAAATDRSICTTSFS